MEGPAAPGRTGRAWHVDAVDEVFAALDSTPTGLTDAEASARVERYGLNEIQRARRITPWRILVEQFRNVLILILLAATALSFVMGHGLESIVIAVIVLFAVLLGFIQEYRAERAIEALRDLAAPTATVLRDGEERAIPTVELVPGDVILLDAGDRVPADVSADTEKCPVTVM